MSFFFLVLSKRLKVFHSFQSVGMLGFADDLATLVLHETGSSESARCVMCRAVVYL